MTESSPLSDLITPPGIQTRLLIDRLVAQGPCRRVGTADIDEFLAADGVAALLFTGDPAQRPEAGDVAVVLGQLLRRYAPALRAAVVDQADEDRLKGRFGVVVVPNLVLVAGGSARPAAVKALIPRIQDWQVYDREVARVLADQARPGAAEA